LTHAAVVAVGAVGAVLAIRVLGARAAVVAAAIRGIIWHSDARDNVDAKGRGCGRC